MSAVVGPESLQKKSDELSEALEFRNWNSMEFREFPEYQHSVAEIVRVLIEAAEAGKDINLNR